jgi:hypothetical protein
MAALMDDFAAEYGAVDCRTLIGRDISTPRGHRAFIDSGVWRETCMSQVETVVRALASLTCPADPADPAAASPAVETSPVDTSPVEPAGTPASEATE